MNPYVEASARASSEHAEGEPASSPGPARSAADTARLRQLAQQHFDFVGRLLRHLGVRSDLDDALQQVFIVLMNKLPEVEIGKERAFLAACAVNIAARHRRSLGTRAKTVDDEPRELPAPEHTPEELTVQRNQLARLDLVLAAMPEEVRAVFLLYEVEELTMLEIAGALAVPQGTVASRLRRAREIIRERLKP